MNSSRGAYQGAYAPAHYLKQFLPKYAGKKPEPALCTAGGKR